MIRIVHLLDDFAMGGVTRALTLFDDPAIAQIAVSEVVPVGPKARIAPALDADLIVDHMPFSWGRLTFLTSLRLRNPSARILHVEHSYTRGFEAHMVGAKGRFRRMIRMSAKLMDEVICVSNAQRDWFVEEVGLASGKVRVIYPWTERPELYDIEPAAPQAGRPLHLLAYGRYAPVKNFEALIDAMRSFEPYQVRLTLFGGGPDHEALVNLAADLPHVEVHGPTNDPAAYLRECDAVIMPSKYESFGLVATEARMAGRPIIVADVDGLPEQAARGGMVTNLETESQIATAIKNTLQSDLPELGHEAREGVLDQNKAILTAWKGIILRAALAKAPRNPVIKNKGRAAA